VESDIHRYANAEDIDRNQPLVQLSERGVRDVVKRTAESAAGATGDDDYRYVSSHDLRRRFAQRLLVEKQVNPRVVMQVGGWDSFQAIEPYLNAPTPDVVNDAFEEAGLA
jgi:integrase